jgi:RNA polymerase sigma-70 factor (ECF subfamily)
MLDAAVAVPVGPEARYEQAQSISLAFVAALQVLPPRQLAVLILRDVLGFHANEVAGMLESTVESANSALKRARASLQRHWAPNGERRVPEADVSRAEAAVVAKFADAYGAGDLDALVALLTDDVFMSMPPMPLEYRGREIVARFFLMVFRANRRFALVPTRANGQPAFGAYLRTAEGPYPGVGLVVLTMDGERISAMSRFDGSMLPWFGLPPVLSGAGAQFRRSAVEP